MASHQTWACKDYELDLTIKTLIMGIINVTPDSFSDGGQYNQPDRAVEHALNMAQDGADIIDVGGESTRPGAQPVSEKDEKTRVLPVIEGIASRLDIPISIDTTKSGVARTAMQAGASIINDISGFRFDRDMIDVARSAKAGVVIMHIQGEPRTMQSNPHYDDLIKDIMDYLAAQKQKLMDHGIEKNRIAVDPGIGFGKNLQHNFDLIRHLHAFLELDCPLLVGPSRKSFIGKVLNLPADQRIEGTAAAVTACILNGAHIVRVHDVKEMKRVVTIADTIIGKKPAKEWRA